MNKQYKPVPREWQLVMDEDTIARAISRMSFEIVEKDRDLKNLAIVGLRTGG
jgi:pyrimidine operon attenuation protein/uracil phosphoribosyltransferase